MALLSLVGLFRFAVFHQQAGHLTPPLTSSGSYMTGYQDIGLCTRY